MAKIPRMIQKAKTGKAIDISRCDRTKAGDYILEPWMFEAHLKAANGIDYADVAEGRWVWSIGRVLTKATVELANGATRLLTPGTCVASLDGRFYDLAKSEGTWECVWVR